MRKFSFIVLITGLCILISMTANADWLVDSLEGMSMGNSQDIVVTLKSNPVKNPEAACLAVTFARMSKMANEMLDAYVNVTLFPTLDGVALGDKKVVSGKRLRHFKCSIPPDMDNEDPSDGYISLEDNLIAFLENNPNNMVICPLCWVERYGTMPPDYGMLPPPCTGPGYPESCMAVMKMTLDADKVFDF